jgi:hypothetical protein
VSQLSVPHPSFLPYVPANAVRMPGYTLHLPRLHTFYTVILNLAVVIDLTPVFNAMSARSAPLDHTAAADYHA